MTDPPDIAAIRKLCKGGMKMLVSKARILALCNELEAARKDLVLQEAAMEARTQAWEAEVERLRGIIANLTSELKKGDERQRLIARQAALAAKGKADG